MERPQMNIVHSSILFGGIILLLLLWMIRVFGLSLPVSVSTRTVSGELAVVGEGKVDVVPDLAQVSAGITVSDAKTVEEAQGKIDAVNSKIVDLIIRLGIDKKDIKTSNYSINPNYNYEPGGRGNILGYSGNANLTITVRDSKKLPQVLNAATEAGANQVYNSGFTIDDPSKFREQARKKAIDNAREEAKKISRELGIHLGRIVNIAESPSAIPVQMFGEVKRLDGTSNAPNIEPGTQTITSTVTLYFERN